MTEPNRPEELRRLGSSFDRTAAEYELGRPTYPRRAFEWWAKRGAFDPGNAVLDLAAGTGKLTRHLPLERCTVTAVEPLANMRAEFERHVPGVEILDGTATDIPSADDSFDTVLVGQAFHWFDAAPALDEIHRVLRPGGGLGLIWNQDDEEAADWLEVLITTKRNVSHSPIAAAIRAVADIGAHGAFDHADSTEIRWTEHTTAERVLANVASRSYVSALDDEQRDDILSHVRLVMHGVVEAFGADIGYPHRTLVYWARHRT